MNQVKIEFISCIDNEAFARTAVLAFLMPYNLEVDEMIEIKTLIQEAISNCIIHAYKDKTGRILMELEVDDQYVLSIKIQDYGVGIEDIELARTPMFSTRKDLERSGLGLTIIENFSDHFWIESKPNEGTCIRCLKQLSYGKAHRENQ